MTHAEMGVAAHYGFDLETLKRIQQWRVVVADHHAHVLKRRHVPLHSAFRDSLTVQRLEPLVGTKTS